MKKVFLFFKKNKSFSFLFLFVISLLLFSLFSPLLLSHSPSEVFEDHLMKPPFFMEGSEKGFLLGTDDLGRDFFSRLIFGAKVSFLAGFIVLFFCLVFGLIFGSLAAFFKTWDAVISIFVDILMSFPGLLIAILVVSLTGPSFFNACLAGSLMCLPMMIRLVRSLILREKAEDYVKASFSFGASKKRVIFFHIYPNILGELTAQSLLTFSEGILAVAALSFLGLGAQAPLAEWGVMIADGRAYLESQWWLASFPGLFILALIFSINLLGERLKELFDPKEET